MSEPAASKDDECCVCLKQPPPDQCFILPCSHMLCAEHARSVARRMGRCPYCQQAFAAEEARPMLDVRDVLTVLCFDTSSSMWYSDGLLGFVGRSRLDTARDTAIDVVRNERREQTAGAQHWVCMSSFDTDWRLVMPPRDVATPLGMGELITKLKKLEPTGRYTAFFDAYHMLLLYLGAVPRWRDLRINVMIFTDGQDNLSSIKNAGEMTEALRSLARALHVVTYYVNVGGSVPRSKRLSDMVDAVFCDVTSANWQYKAMSIASTTTHAAEASLPPAAPQELTYAQRALRVVDDVRASLLAALPSVPSRSPGAAELSDGAAAAAAADATLIEFAQEREAGDEGDQAQPRVASTVQE
eukprot:m51a1_g1728 hypothetical protein (356) ;mRNA; r:133212-134643